MAHYDEKGAVVGIPAQDQPMLKSEPRQIIRDDVEEEIVQQGGLCKA